ncbi:hypothetical protein CKQ90_29290, partial [Klebsiella pneumoniae]
RGETEAMFQQIDGDWWNSHRRVPDKFLVLKRNWAPGWRLMSSSAATAVRWRIITRPWMRR